MDERTESLRAEIGRLADEIETEMRGARLWLPDAEPINPSMAHGAFGSGSMSFEQWLQLIFLPALREVASGARDVPDGSQVRRKAHREWRMWGAPLEGVDRLLVLLGRVDDLVEGRVQPNGEEPAG